MNRTVSRALACVGMAALAVTLLTVAPSSAEPGYHQPKVGSCHVVSLRQALSPSAPTATVDCDRRHTTKTLLVSRMRGNVDWDGNQVWRAGVPQCKRKLRKALGGSDKVASLSAYGSFSFIPTPQERAHGAKWKRCEVGLVGGRKLQPLPKKLALDELPLPDRYARCLAGSEKHLMLTVCAKSHSYRATGAVRVGGKKYPGERKLTRIALERCPGQVTSRTWRYEINTGPLWWPAGWHSIICYSKTKQ